MNAFRASATSLERVRTAVTKGELIVTEGRIAASPRDAVLETEAEQVVALLVLAADVLQAEARRRNEGTGGVVARAGLSAANHLLRLPGFADAVTFNTVQDWAVVALRLEMFDKGQGPDLSAAPEARAAMTRIDASFLRYLLDSYPDSLGRGMAETVLSGLPAPLPDPAGARDLLSRVALAMENGEMRSWGSLNVTVSDTDPDVRTAKALAQVAMRNIHGGTALWRGLIPGRDANAVREFATRLVGLDGAELAPFLKGFLVQEGLVGFTDMGSLREPSFSGKALEAAILTATKGATSYQNVSPEIAAELTEAARVLQVALDADRSVTLGTSASASPESKALRNITRCVAMSIGSVGDMGVFDFHGMLAHIPGELRIRGPVNNVAQPQPEPMTLEQATARLGRTLPWTSSQARALEQWAARVEFDPHRAVETAAASHVLFKHMMHSMISYDLWVAPFVKSRAALSSWPS